MRDILQGCGFILFVAVVISIPVMMVYSRVTSIQHSNTIEEMGITDYRSAAGALVAGGGFVDLPKKGSWLSSYGCAEYVVPISDDPFDQLDKISSIVKECWGVEKVYVRVHCVYDTNGSYHRVLVTESQGRPETQYLER